MTEQDDKLVADARAYAARSNSHARTCKKPPAECAVCVAVLKWAAELPPHLLARVLAE